MLTSEPDNIEAAAWIIQLQVAVITWLVVAVAFLFGLVLGIGPTAEFWLVMLAWLGTYSILALATIDTIRLLRAAAGLRALLGVPYLVILVFALPAFVAAFHIERVGWIVVFVGVPTLEMVLLAIWYPGGVRFQGPSRR